ncbi:MAG: DUF5715 family protein [Pyrinomonadaceae bacterium]
MRYKLHISGPYETRSVTVDGEVSVGRTNLATIQIDDPGLSRVNTTFFLDEGELLVADENSTNGTYVNGERLIGRPRIVKQGDEIRIGSNTLIRIEQISEQSLSPPVSSVRTSKDVTSKIDKPKPANILPSSDTLPAGGIPKWVYAASASLTLLILLLGGLAIYILLRPGRISSSPTASRTVPVTTLSVIPVRVIDPLGGEDEEDLDDLIASWETAEEEIKAENVADVTVDPTDKEEADLNVTAAFLADRIKKAMEQRNGETGIRPAGLNVPKELFGDGVIKQKAKLKEMNMRGYRQPMDFADLAAKRLSRELIEMPMATNSFYLDVGGSASDGPFTSFAFPDQRQEIVSGHPKFDALARLAENFSGRKYDLNNPADRKQMRMRLLRMFQPRAKGILKEIADAYFQRFGRPLRVTSLTRSMDYQILLNSNNANSFKVRGEGSLPPHTSGCAFDLARKHMTAEEQNFLMAKLAEMERAGKLDALIEYGVNACFHIFIYDDGIPPRM